MQDYIAALSGLVQATGHLKDTIIGLLPRKWTVFLYEQKSLTYKKLLCLRRGSAAVPVELIQWRLNRPSLFCDLLFLIWLWMESSAGDSNSRLPPYRFFNPLNRLLPSSLSWKLASTRGLLMVDGVLTDGREESGWTDGGRRVQGFSPHTHSRTHLSSFSCRAAGLLSPLWNELLRIKGEV